MADISKAVNASGPDIGPIRQNIYLGPGYHVIRGYMAPSHVDHIRSYWQTHRNPRSGIEVGAVAEGSPDFSNVSPDLDQHFGHFWNRPLDQFTYVSSWELQVLRNRIEGNDPNMDFLPHAYRNRFEREYCSYAAYRLTLTRRAGAISDHVDWPLNHARVQLSLMLSSYGEDYEGGLLFHDEIRGGTRRNLCKEENLQKGDLLIFRYFHKHGVEAVTTPEGKPGFCRLLMPLRYMPAKEEYAKRSLPRRLFGKLPEPTKKVLRAVRSTSAEPTLGKQYKELRAGDHDEVFYYDSEEEKIMRLAVEKGVDPTEVYYHRGLWARWKMMADWQFNWLRDHGLLPQHHFLDIGCGPARLGVNLVPYLEDDRYCGVDPLPAFVDLGHVYLREIALTKKAYHLACTEDFDFAQFDRKFDFALAHSVFTHLSYELIERCLESLAQVMKPGGQLIFTITMGADREKHFVYVQDVPMTSSMHKDMSLYEELGKKIGFRVELLGREDHPSQYVCRATFNG